MTNGFPVRVYYEDTDTGGIVYYANYLKFAERARSEFLREIGLENTTLREQHNVLIVVRHVEADYLKPAYLDDLLFVESTVTEVRNTSFTMRQVVNRDDETLVSMSVRLVCINDTGRPVRIPGDLKAAITKNG